MLVWRQGLGSRLLAWTFLIRLIAGVVLLAGSLLVWGFGMGGAVAELAADCAAPVWPLVPAATRVREAPPEDSAQVEELGDPRATKLEALAPKRGAGKPRSSNARHTGASSEPWAPATGDFSPARSSGFARSPPQAEHCCILVRRKCGLGRGDGGCWRGRGGAGGKGPPVRGGRWVWPSGAKPSSTFRAGRERPPRRRSAFQWAAWSWPSWAEGVPIFLEQRG